MIVVSLNKNSVQNLIIFHFCSILRSINQFTDHIITFSLAWNFLTKTNKQAHVPANLLHSRRIPKMMCFLSLWKSIVPADFLCLKCLCHFLSFTILLVFSQHPEHLMRSQHHLKNLLVCLSYQTPDFQTSGLTSTTPFYFGHTLQKDEGNSDQAHK